MKRIASRKSHSWWWDSHISPKNSRWLFENLEQMDRLVKEMLKLIEEEGDSFAKKAEMYYRRRPQLVSHVEDFYRMYRALAERYDNVTGELRKNVSSDLHSQSSGNGSDFGTEPASPSFSHSPDRTPERKKNQGKRFGRAAGFDVFLQSTANSDFSRRGSNDSPLSSSSSSSLESSSDSGDEKVVDADNDTSGLTARIVQLEEELREVREKLKGYENGFNGQYDHFMSTNHREPESENKTVVLEDEIRSLKEAMEVAAKKYEDEISLKNHIFEEYKTQVDAALDTLRREKSNLYNELNCSISDLKLEAKQLSEKKSMLEIRISEQNQMIMELKKSVECSAKFLHEELEFAKCESCSECAKLRAELNKTVDSFKLKVDILTSEKDELNARVSKLVNSKNSHEGNLKVLENRVRELEAEKSKTCNESSKLMAELDEYKLKVDMLLSEKDELNARITELIGLKNNHESKIKALENLLIESEAAKIESSNKNVKLQDEMNQSLDKYKQKVDSLTADKDELNAKLSTLINSKNIYEAKIEALEHRLKELEIDKAEAYSQSAEHIDELNQRLDSYKLKVDMLTADKDELNARISKLMDDAKSRDDNSLNMSMHLHQLQIEHVNQIKEIEEAKKRSMELINRMRELEGEVEKQRLLILDSAEAKREAIRQLCFSLEHYRDGYQKLRQLVQGHNRRVAVMAT